MYAVSARVGRHRDYAEYVIRRQNRHRAEAAAVRRLGRAGWLRVGRMRGREPAPAAAAAALQPARDRLRYKKEEEKWEKVS